MSSIQKDNIQRFLSDLSIVETGERGTVFTKNIPRKPGNKSKEHIRIDPTNSGPGTRNRGGNNLRPGSNLARSTAHGYFQIVGEDGHKKSFKGSSLNTALNRLKIFFKNIVKVKLPQRFENVYEHKDVSLLSYNDQALLTLTNFFMRKDSKKIKKLLAEVSDYNPKSAKELYRTYHLTKAKTGAQQYRKIKDKADKIFGGGFMERELDIGA